MAVSELLRGIGGVVAGLLVLLVILASAIETRERFGQTERGVAWVAGYKVSKTERFDRLHVPLLYLGIPVAVVGYMTGIRLTTRRRIKFAIVGACNGLLIGLVIPSPLPRKFGRAGSTTLGAVYVLATMLGACVGALIAGRRERRRCLLNDESD